MEDPSRARWLGESGMFPGAPSSVRSTCAKSMLRRKGQRIGILLFGCECCRTITQGLIEPRKTWVGAVIGAPEYGRGTIGRRAFISMRGKRWRCFE